MTFKNASILLQNQDRNLRKIKNVRYVHDGFEYRIDYRGGFAAYIAIDRRQVGKRNFQYFSGISAADCLTAEAALELAKEEIVEKS